MTVAKEEKKDDKKGAEGTMSKTEQVNLFRQIGLHIKGQNETMTALRQEVAELRGAKGDDDADKGGDDKKVDSKTLEEMSRSEFGDHLVDRMTKVLAPIQASVQSEKETRTRASLTEQVNTANTAHPDFVQWHDEIKDLIKIHPTMNVEEAYQLAISKDPDKIKGIEVELKKVADDKAAKKEEEDEKSGNVMPIFGGLLPTSGVTSPKKDGTMTSKEAAEAAWDATKMSEHLAAVSEN